MVPKVVEAGGKIPHVKNTFKIVARSVSEFNVLTLKYSPIDVEQMISCGKENIRFWRIKNKRCAGGAVV